jgi:hypothetical protein
MDTLSPVTLQDACQPMGFNKINKLEIRRPNRAILYAPV